MLKTRITAHSCHGTHFIQTFTAFMVLPFALRHATNVHSHFVIDLEREEREM